MPSKNPVKTRSHTNGKPAARPARPPLWLQAAQFSLAAAFALSPLLGGNLYVGLRSTPPEMLLADWLWNGQMPLMGGMLLALFVLVAFMAVVWGADITRLPVMKLTLPLLMLGGWLGLSVIKAGGHWFAFQRFAEWGVALLFFFTVAALVRRGRLGLSLVVSLVAGATLVSLRGIAEYAGAYSSGNPSWRIFATFFNPNFLAGYLVITIPVTWGLLVYWLRATGDDPRMRLYRLLLTVAAWLQMSALVLTGSRAGLGAMVVSMAIFSLLQLRHLPMDYWLRLASVGVLLAGVVWLASPAAQRLTPQVAQQEVYSGAFRVETWKGAARMIQQNPLLGVGMGSFDWQYPAYAHTGYTRNAHSSYLDLASEAGLPALLFLFWFGMVWLWKAGQRESGGTTDSSADWRSLQMGLIAGVLASAAHNAVDSDLNAFCHLLILFGLFGLGVGLAIDATTPVPVKRVGRRLGGILLSILLLWHFVSVGVGEIAANFGKYQMFLGHAPQAESELKSALAWDSTNPDYMLEYAELSFVTGERDKAFNLFEQAIRSKPSPRNYYRYGLYLERDGRVSEAEAEFREGIKRDPNNLPTLLRLARLLEGENRSDEALKLYERLTEIEKTPYGQVQAVPEIVETAYAFAHLKLGIRQEKQGDLEGAEARYRQAHTVFEAYRQRTLPFNRAARAMGRYNPEREREIGSGHLETVRRLIAILEKKDASEEVASLREIQESLENESY